MHQLARRQEGEEAVGLRSPRPAGGRRSVGGPRGSGIIMVPCAYGTYNTYHSMQLKRYRILPLFTAFYRDYLTVGAILELVKVTLPKNNYREKPENTGKFPRVRPSPTFFGNPVTGKSKPRPSLKRSLAGSSTMPSSFGNAI